MRRLSPRIGLCGNNRGAALLITLAAVVLLTVLILAFFSHSLLNRQISFSNTNLIKADQLARSALEIVKGELREEIADPSYSSTSNGGSSTYPTFYQPLVPANSIPQKAGLSSSATSNLIAISFNNTSSSGSIDPTTNGRAMGSSVSIGSTATSLNGRYLSNDRWFGSGGPQLGTNGNGNSNLPTWVYVTRGGIQPPVLSSVANPTSTGYVIGRFAYTVYDQGGLMDANVAGYPAVGAAMAPFKPSLAFADLGTALGITGLAGWRNASTVTGADANTFTEWASGLARTSGTPNAAALAAAASGHLSAVAGDNAFFSRQDLLLAAQSGIAGLSTSQAQSLTHFSRTLNAPSWTPLNATSWNSAVDAATNPDLSGGVRFAAAATLLHYDDKGMTTSYNVLPGDPLIQRRFSLAKLAWLTYRGVETGISAQAVQACFGLTWNAATEQWTYQAPEDAAPATTIKTLAQVAGLPTSQAREPNFFELLKAGILAGSTGLAGNGSAANSSNVTVSDPFTQGPLDASTDLQILRIGANILDETTSDNYPTTLTLSMSIGGTSYNVPVHGVKDLPYLYSVLTPNFCNVSNITTTVTAGVTTYNITVNNLALVMVPELFNPHVPSGATVGPASLRVRLANAQFKDAYNTGTANLNHLTAYTPAAASISFPYSSGLFRSGVAPITSTLSPTGSSFSSLLNWVTDATNYGFLIYNYTTGLPTTITGASGNSVGPLRATVSSDVLVVLEYLSPTTNQWRVYDTLCGNEALQATGKTGLGAVGYSGAAGTAYLEFNPGVGVSSQTGSLSASATDNSAIRSGDSYSKIDPRTTRLGIVASGQYFLTIPAPLPPASTTSKPYWYGYRTHLPFGSGVINGSGNATGMFPGFWPQGGTTGWYNKPVGNTTNDNNAVANVSDPDGTFRPADGWLGNPPSLSAGKANLFQNVTQTNEAMGRPIILGRPFRSVAELGYVFRDSPWKSLSFFDPSSGDGALLDLFSVSDEPSVIAGRIELNSSQSAMQQALLSGVGQAYDGTSPLPSTANIAADYQNYAYASGSPTATLPINPAQLPSFLSSSTLTAADYTTTTNPIKNYRESVVRALTAGTQTRTWNLLIDVVAQVGRFPTTGTPPSSLANFLVEGEKRYWLSVAIDRYTGKVLDEQWEPVSE